MCPGNNFKKSQRKVQTFQSMKFSAFRRVLFQCFPSMNNSKFSSCQVFKDLSWLGLVHQVVHSATLPKYSNSPACSKLLPWQMNLECDQYATHGGWAALSPDSTHVPSLCFTEIWLKNLVSINNRCVLVSSQFFPGTQNKLPKPRPLLLAFLQG